MKKKGYQKSFKKTSEKGLTNERKYDIIIKLHDARNERKRNESEKQ